MKLPLQCPRCQQKVSVSENAAGTRVQCPHCNGMFLAPGSAKQSGGDEDDWLSLDDNSSTKRDSPYAPPSTKAPSPKTASEASSSLSDEDKAILKDFSEELEAFASESEPLPTVSAASGNESMSAIKTDDQSGGIDLGNAGFDSSPASSQPPAAREIEYADEYRVSCNICSSITHVKAKQQGTKIKCGDCHSEIIVPPPPKVKKREAVDLSRAETYAFSPSKAPVQRSDDPYRKSAQQLLDEASRVEDDSIKPNTDNPDVIGWLKGIFGIFKDIGVIAHWLALSLFASVPAFMALKFENPMLTLGLFPAGLLLFMLVVACGFAILQSVANGEERVSEWPVFDPGGWAAQLFVALAAAGFSAIPVWALTMILFEPSIINVAVTMLSLYILFPFVLLSMLDMDSPFMPFSAEVARSVTKCQESWGALYFTAGFLFAGVFFVYVCVSSGSAPSTIALLTIPITIAAAFVYFAMIGQLAYSIGQVIVEPRATTQELGESASDSSSSTMSSDA